MPKSGQESFQAWLQRHAQGFIDATSWEEFHGIADAHGVRLDLRANGFVFTNRRSLIHVKASSIDRRLAKTALEARLGTFVAADYEQGSEKQEYQKRPRFARVDTSRLWESIRPGPTLCGHTNGTNRAIMRSLPKLLASGRLSHWAVSSF